MSESAAERITVGAAVRALSDWGVMPMRALSTCCARVAEATPAASESTHAATATRAILDRDECRIILRTTPRR
jgi:hypothetical protein